MLIRFLLTNNGAFNILKQIVLNMYDSSGYEFPVARFVSLYHRHILARVDNTLGNWKRKQSSAVSCSCYGVGNLQYLRNYKKILKLHFIFTVAINWLEWTGKILDRLSQWNALKTKRKIPSFWREGNPSDLVRFSSPFHPRLCNYNSSRKPLVIVRQPSASESVTQCRWIQKEEG